MIAHAHEHERRGGAGVVPKQEHHENRGDAEQQVLALEAQRFQGEEHPKGGLDSPHHRGRSDLGDAVDEPRGGEEEPHESHGEGRCEDQIGGPVPRHGGHGEDLHGFHGKRQTVHETRDDVGEAHHDEKTRRIETTGHHVPHRERKERAEIAHGTGEFTQRKLEGTTFHENSSLRLSENPNPGTLHRLDRAGASRNLLSDRKNPARTPAATSAGSRSPPQCSFRKPRILFLGAFTPPPGQASVPSVPCRVPCTCAQSQRNAVALTMVRTSWPG